MAKVKNVVKVMNFHALLRVDKAKRSADKILQIEEQVTQMIDLIQNNQNFIVDHKVFVVDESKPGLTVYLGSDYGFCGNYNTVINEALKSDPDGFKIVIGKKVNRSFSNVLFESSVEEFQNNPILLYDVLKDGIINKKYGRITLVYNRYYSISDIRLEKKIVYPIDIDKNNIDETNYYEDWMYEGDLNSILKNLFLLYLQYEIKICTINTSAAENILRQNTTNESLKKIAEQEEVHQREERKERKYKQSSKMIEMYSKNRQRG